jgi:gliding motility-associated-like protein
VKLFEVSNGCGADTVIKIKVDSISIAAFAAPNVCLGTATAFTNSSTGASTYSWNFGDPSSGVNNTSNLMNPSHTFGAVGSYIVTLVTKVSGSSCADTAKQTVTVSAVPTVSIAGNHSICAGTNTVLTASGSGITSYLWSTTQTTASIVVNPVANITYSVTVSNGTCSVTDTFNVYVTPKPPVTITGATKICQGDSVTLTASSPVGVYTWNNGSTGSTIVVPVTKATTYYVVVTKGCSDTAYHTVTVIPVTAVEACCDTTIAAGGTVHLIGSGAVGYVWTPSGNISCYTCPNTTATPTVNTTYTVMGTDSNGCRSYDTVRVEIACHDFEVPNVFTPVSTVNFPNNVFYIAGAIGEPHYKIEIYDRWGVLMYTTDDPSASWTGKTMAGQDVPDGVYYYIIKSSCAGNNYDKHGFVQVIRK